MDKQLLIEASKLGFITSAGTEIKPGDTYIAMRNTEIKLLTAKEIKDNFIVPVENEYCYNIWECRKVTGVL